MKNNDLNILDKKYKSPIVFLGKPRELGKTTKRVNNKIVFLLKKEAQISQIVDPDKYQEEIDGWMEDVKKFVKTLISPITDEELEFIEEDDLVDIVDAIERRKRLARGMTNEEVDILEKAGRKALVNSAKLSLGEDEGVSEDFPQTQSTDQDMNTGKQNTTED